MSRRAMYEAHKEALQRIVWRLGYPAHVAARKLGCGLSTLYSKWIPWLTAEIGKPTRNCRCGLPILHRAQCLKAESPACPQCGVPAARNGRARTSEGEREQRYICNRCGVYVYRVQPVKYVRSRERFERFRKELANEKIVVAALELGVSEQTIQNYRRKLRCAGRRAA